jgi:hypothetical protein
LEAIPLPRPWSLTHSHRLPVLDTHGEAVIGIRLAHVTPGEQDTGLGGHMRTLTGWDPAITGTAGIRAVGAVNRKDPPSPSPAEMRGRRVRRPNFECD